MVLSILLDCDPGHNDTIAIVLVLASSELDTEAIMPSTGSWTSEEALHSVLRMLILLDRADIPIAGGTIKPLMRELTIADNVHGESGLDGPALLEPTFAPQNYTAVELVARTLHESTGPVTIVSTGLQANVILLLSNHPKLHSEIARIVIMGGVMGLGNWTPAAEFNTYIDPEAAEIVLQSGIPVAMVDLDVTHRTQVHTEDTERFRAIGNPVSTIVAELLDFFLEYHRDKKWGFIDASLRDLYTIVWSLKPELFTTVEHWAGVETQGKHTQGMMVVDYYYLTGNKPNVTIMIDADR